MAKDYAMAKQAGTDLLRIGITATLLVCSIVQTVRLDTAKDDLERTRTRLRSVETQLERKIRESNNGKTDNSVYTFCADGSVMETASISIACLDGVTK